MTTFKKIAAVALASATLATGFASSASAAPWHHRHHGWRGGAIAAGLLGGAVLGAALARPAYAAPVAYEEPECYRKHVGYTYSGRPIFRTVCY